MAAILATFALSSAIVVGLSIWATSRSQHRAAVLEIAARQRTLSERYVKEVLLVRSGAAADPATTAVVLRESARALLDGGLAPAVNGDDDDTPVSGASDPVVRGELEQEQRLVRDLTATGSALLAGRPVTVGQTAHEHIRTTDPIERLRILSDLTSNVSLNAARTIAANADHSLSGLIVIQIALGVAGLSVSLLLALALVAATRRRTAHFRSIVSASTDLVLVFDEDGCRYVSDSVTAMVGVERTRCWAMSTPASSIPTISRPCAWPGPGPGPRSSSSGWPTSSRSGAISRPMSRISARTGTFAEW